MKTTNWYVEVIRSTREIRNKAFDGCNTKSKAALAKIKDYLKADLTTLNQAWPEKLICPRLEDLARHVHFGTPSDYGDILKHDLPDIEKAADNHFLKTQKTDLPGTFEFLLHAVVVESSLEQFHQGHFRDAVLNSMVGLCDHIRDVVKSGMDGAKLINTVFGGDQPVLVLSELITESGKNDQSGFHKIFLGAYEGIRNPKAHTLSHDLTRIKAAQYLVFASLLARRVDECKLRVKS